MDSYAPIKLRLPGDGDFKMEGRCNLEEMKDILTLPETNSEFTPENQWFEDEISFWDGLF